MIFALFVLLSSGGALADSNCSVAPVRLVDGPNERQGRVEIFHNGEWGTVCDDCWDTEDARVVCRQLGLLSENPNPRAQLKAAHGQGQGPIMLDDVACSGSENCLHECTSRGNYIHNCIHTEDAGVSCADVRLVDGPDNNQGRVEVFYNGTWGTVCDDGWDSADARVVCNQLGLPSNNAIARSRAEFGEGVGVIWMSNMRCTGNENRLSDCLFGGFGDYLCGHNEDAGVICSGIRLAGGPDNSQGRVEVFYNGTWGTVCDDSWDNADARVVCNQLGLPSNNAIARSRAEFGEGVGVIWTSNMRCTGNENRLSDCPFGGFGDNLCGHNEDAGVICSGIRLVGGPDSSQGRVEVFYNGTWGTVYDDSWDNADARVVCNQLGFPSNLYIARSQSTFGEGEGVIWMSNVHCTGNESTLSDCPFDGYGEIICGHFEDAGVECSRTADKAIRLVNGTNDSQGRVEVFYNGAWGTVCDDRWDSDDASVVCRELGLPSDNAGAVVMARFGEGRGEIWMDDVQCTGSESRLADCAFNPEHNCQHYEDAGVDCINKAIRLVNGPNDNQGRVEVFYNGAWGTVCDDRWDSDDASVVCRELGLPSDNAVAVVMARFGEGEGEIWMDDVQCTGSESRLADCAFNPEHNCQHYEDAGVNCRLLFQSHRDHLPCIHWTKRNRSHWLGHGLRLF